MTAPAPEERVKFGDQYYLVTSSRVSRRTKRVLGHQDLFAVFDLSGDIPPAGLEDLGLFFHGMRHLDRLELRVNGDFPHFLDSTVSPDNVQLVTELTNTDARDNAGVEVPRDTIAVRRVKTLFHDRLYERIELASYHSEPVRCELLILVHADFADIFELRGMTRPRRGSLTAPLVRGQRVVYGYRGCDERVRRTVITVDQPPDSCSADGFLHARVLAPGERWTVELAVTCTLEGVPPSAALPFEEARSARRTAERAWLDAASTMATSNEFATDWLRRSAADVAMLRSVEHGQPYIYAGIPWFATMFGRDGIVTALAMLAFAPDIAAGTLRRLAALQGVEENAARDEQPGKIVHEVRDDEMAACGEVPFARYYGSVDSTPLFLMLAAAYVRRTGDLELAAELWPHLERALHWIDAYGDRDHDGYVEYRRETPRGLANQGWKDSHDAIFHADGRLAEPPIALVEVQGYVFGARRGLAALARRLGHDGLAADLERQAAELRRSFQRDFWMADEGFYALALDGEKRRCEVIASNAGHCLLTGLVPAEAGRWMADRLMRRDLFCGWGIRTLSSQAPRFNPMSYHNGSVWPHDNALIAAGFRRYGAGAEAARLFGALFDAGSAVEGFRLPELFCGFERREHGTPVPYPVACRPQAWAAASAFLLLQSALGLRFDAPRGRIVFDRPRLPDCLEWILIRNLRLGDACVDVQVAGRRLSSAVEVVRREGSVEVLVRK